jgi:hypothetical protein
MWFNLTRDTVPLREKNTEKYKRRTEDLRRNIWRTRYCVHLASPDVKIFDREINFWLRNCDICYKWFLFTKRKIDKAIESSGTGNITFLKLELNLTHT